MNVRGPKNVQALKGGVLLEKGEKRLRNDTVQRRRQTKLHVAYGKRSEAMPSSTTNPPCVRGLNESSRDDKRLEVRAAQNEHVPKPSEDRRAFYFLD